MLSISFWQLPISTIYLKALWNAIVLCQEKWGKCKCYVLKKIKLNEISLWDRRIVKSEGHITVETQYQHPCSLEPRKALHWGLWIFLEILCCNVSFSHYLSSHEHIPSPRRSHQQESRHHACVGTKEGLLSLPVKNKHKPTTYSLQKWVHTTERALKSLLSFLLCDANKPAT